MNKAIASLIIGSLIVVIGVLFITERLNTVALTITPRHITSYNVENSDKKTIYSSNSSEQATLRVPKSSKVTIRFVGEANYETNARVINTGDSNKSITLTPYYSSDYLKTLYQVEEPAINSALQRYSNDVSKYSVSTRLHHYGEWATTTLTWKGDYGENTDTLHVILKKKDQTWEVVAPPSILFFYKNYPSIPVDILRQVNNN